MGKTCIECGGFKPIGDFYRHSRMADGHSKKCKECTKSYMRTNRRRTRQSRTAYDRERYQRPERKRIAQKACKLHRYRHPDRASARGFVCRSIRDGILVRTPCEVCGDPKVEAHHDDYLDPLNVRWLCFRHHREVHGQVVAQETTKA